MVNIWSFHDSISTRALNSHLQDEVSGFAGMEALFLISNFLRHGKEHFLQLLDAAVYKHIVIITLVMGGYIP